ncbi:MAG: phage portal protein [Jatrophihabitantaceae bacterium]
MPIIREALKAQQQRSRRSLPWLGGRSTSAGVDVAPERALQVSSVYACVRTHADDTAGLPLGLYQRRGGKRTRVEDHPTMRLLTEEPNPTMDSAEFWRTVVGWQGIRGNGYVFIERDGNAKPVGLWPIAPTSIDVRRNNHAADGSRRGLLIYHATLDGISEYAPIPDDGFIQPENMLHFRTFGLGPVGLSPIGLARQTIGTSFAAQEYIGGFFQRDASPGGIVSVTGNLTDTQYERLGAQWKDLHEGVGNSHRLAVLEGGAKWEKVSLDPADANFIEVMKFGRVEIASMFRMPLHKIGDLERATFNNIEQLSIEYVAGLMPYLIRGERVARKLFAEPNMYLRFDPKGLLRGDVGARYTAYALARQWGWQSVNDIRRDEDEDPIEGGDDYLQPLNMVPVGQAPTAPANRAAAAVAPPGSFLIRCGGCGRLHRSADAAVDCVCKQRAARSAGAVPADATMVALYPDADAARGLAVPGGLAAEDLHVTLAYLGTGLGADEVDTAQDLLRSIARQHAGLAGTVAGLGHFPDAGDGAAFYAPVDVNGVSELRDRLVDELTAAGVPVSTEHGFLPHVTLSWVIDGEAEPSEVPATAVRFEQVSLVVGSHRTDFPLTGQRIRSTE